MFTSMVDVNIRISSSMEQIVSPCNLARAIGVAPGAKLLLRRDTARAEQSGMVVRCDRPTASLLRRRFSRPRPYTHEGQLTSLQVVGMKLVVDRGDDGGAVLRPAQGGPKSLRFMGLAIDPPPSSSPVSAVEAALEVIERAKTDGLHVPGVAELYEDFFAGRRVSATGRRKGAGTRRRRSKKPYDEEEKKCEQVEEKESGEPATSSDEAKQDDSSSSEGSCSSAENGRWHKPVTWRQHRRPAGRQNKHWRDRKTGEEECRKLIGQLQRWRNAVAAHQRRWHHGRVRSASVEDVTLAFDRISNQYANAPRKSGRAEVVSLLARVYADGAFASNRQRENETLDHLGVARWHARVGPPVPLQTTTAAESSSAPMLPQQRHESRRIASWSRWFRLLRRVLSLVRGIIDFGVFIQMYATALGRLSHSLRIKCEKNGRMAKGDNINSKGRSARYVGARRDTGEREASRLEKGFREEEEGGKRNVESNNCQHIGTADNPAAVASAADSVHPQHDSDHPLPWLFPERDKEGGARRAFNLHSVCGGAIHGLITLESAAAIVRDAGKVFPMKRAWRWRCEKAVRHVVDQGHAAAGNSMPAGAGCLLGFQEFLEMCEALKDHMMDVSVMGQENCCSSSHNS